MALYSFIGPNSLGDCWQISLITLEIAGSQLCDIGIGFSSEVPQVTPAVRPHIGESTDGLTWHSPGGLQWGR